MKAQGKKKYEKPNVKKIHLDAKCAVLGFCKTTGTIGPRGSNCGIPINSYGAGS